MATRFYLPSTGAAPISPDYSSGWEDTTQASRLKLVTTKISSAMTTATFLDSNATDRDCLVRQWVSAPLAAQTISAQTIELQMRCGQVSSAGGGNNFLTWLVKVVAPDGTTVRGYIVGSSGNPRRDDTEMAFANPTPPLTNRRDTLTTTSVAVTAGDYLVIEIGTGGDPGIGSDHDVWLRIGDADASDLPEDDTDTTDKNPWVEFPNDITFQSATSSRRMLMGVG